MRNLPLKHLREGAIDQGTSKRLPSKTLLHRLRATRNVVASLFLLLPGASNGALVYADPLGKGLIDKFVDGVKSVFVQGGAGLSDPQDMVTDNLGNLYVTNQGSNTVYKFTPSGVASVYDMFQLNKPIGLAFDYRGNLYVSNFGDNTITKISATGSTAQFAHYATTSAHGLVCDSAGNLYAAYENLNSVVKFTPGGAASVFATLAMDKPVDLAIDSSDNLYVANLGSDNILKVTPGGSVSLFAATDLANLLSIAFDGDGNLYASDYSGKIERFAPDGSLQLYAQTGVQNGAFLAVAIPEPTSGLLLLTGALLLCYRRPVGRAH